MLVHKENRMGLLVDVPYEKWVSHSVLSFADTE